MHQTATLRLARMLWLGALLIFIVNALYPVSTGLTRASGLVLFIGVWFGALALGWRRRVFRFSLLGVTLLTAGFLALPTRRQSDPDALRSDYIAGLRRYRGVGYSWGGESPLGIDCSGLIRRGLVDAMFLRGVYTFNPDLVRRALWLWWHDCSADDLGKARPGGATVALFEAPSLNTLDHSQLLPGDLAVTRSGVHILAYTGDHTWIQADPEPARVVEVVAPDKNSSWFNVPMRLVRWGVLVR